MKLYAACRQLAAWTFLDLAGRRSPDIDWRSFGDLLDGIELVQRYESSGDADELNRAAEQFRHAVERSPAYAAAYHNLGLVYELQGRDLLAVSANDDDGHAAVESAVRMYEEAIHRDPALSPSYLKLGRLRARDLGFRPRDPELALDNASSALKNAGGNVSLSGSAHNLLGELLAERAERDQDTREMVRDYRQSIGNYRKASRCFAAVQHHDLDGADPSDEWLENTVGLVAAYLAFAQDLPTDPGFTSRSARVRGDDSVRLESETRRRTARTAVRLRPSAALAHAAFAAALVRDDPLVWDYVTSPRNRIPSRRRANRVQKAYGHLVEALGLDPTSTDVVGLLRRFFPEDDLDFIRLSLAMDPNDTDVWEALAQAAQRKGAWRDEIAVRGLITALDPWNVGNLRFLAQAHDALSEESDDRSTHLAAGPRVSEDCLGT